MDRSVTMRNENFEVTMHHEAFGGVSHIRLFKERPEMSWVHWYKDEPKNYTWDIEFNAPSDRSLPLKQDVPPVWGLGYIDADGFCGGFGEPVSFDLIEKNECRINYKTPVLSIDVKRLLKDEGTLYEEYVLTNISGKPLKFGEGSLGIFTPFYDEYYGGTPVAMTSRCNTHIWCGGASSYIKTTHMSGQGPNIGLVLTQGQLSSYSISNRIWDSPYRGYFLLHPSPAVLKAEESVRVAWRLFAHDDWDDFFEKAMCLSDVVRLEAQWYTIFEGDSLNITARSGRSLEGSVVAVNGEKIEAVQDKKQILAVYKPDNTDEYTIELEHNGKTSYMKTCVSPPVDKLIEKRVTFLIENQQLNNKDSAADGAYVPYDNETDQQVYDPKDQDLASGGERVGMGVLVARYLPLCKDKGLKQKLRASLDKYYAFVLRQLYNEKTGEVCRGINKKQPERIYNYPWMSDLHVAMFKLTGDKQCLERFVKLYQNYYLDKQGYSHYGIGIPIAEGLDALRNARMDAEYNQMLNHFTKHAQNLVKFGTNYPAFEVPFEQSIVAPAANILLEIYQVTKDEVYFEAACDHLRVLNAFNGLQPDYHLHDIAIRHWDGYWLGKNKMYGDCFPHHWSTITAMVFYQYYKCSGDQKYKKRSEQILRNNLCLFTPEGRGRCVYIYPLTVNDKPGKFYDPYANDQDWALVNWLKIKTSNINKDANNFSL